MDTDEIKKKLDINNDIKYQELNKDDLCKYYKYDIINKIFNSNNILSFLYKIYSKDANNIISRIELKNHFNLYCDNICGLKYDINQINLYYINYWSLNTFYKLILKYLLNIVNLKEINKYISIHKWNDNLTSNSLYVDYENQFYNNIKILHEQSIKDEIEFKNYKLLIDIYNNKIKWISNVNLIQKIYNSKLKIKNIFDYDFARDASIIKQIINKYGFELTISCLHKYFSDYHNNYNIKIFKKAVDDIIPCLWIIDKDRYIPKNDLSNIKDSNSFYIKYYLEIDEIDKLNKRLIPSTKSYYKFYYDFDIDMNVIRNFYENRYYTNFECIKCIIRKLKSQKFPII